MKIKLIFALIIFTASNNLFAQELNIGYRLEPYMYSLKEVRNDGTYSSKYTFAPLLSMYFLIGESLSDEYELYLKPGFLIAPNKDFDGPEIGLQLNKNNFLTNQIYLTGGINLHFTRKTSHGTQLMEVTDSKIIYFLFLGAGYNLSDQIAFDITFHQALNPEYGYRAYTNEYNNIKGPTKINNLIKISFQFTTD